MNSCEDLAQRHRDLVDELALSQVKQENELARSKREELVAMIMLHGQEEEAIAQPNSEEGGRGPSGDEGEKGQEGGGGGERDQEGVRVWDQLAAGALGHNG